MLSTRHCYFVLHPDLDESIYVPDNPVQIPAGALLSYMTCMHTHELQWVSSLGNSNVNFINYDNSRNPMFF